MFSLLEVDFLLRDDSNINAAVAAIIKITTTVLTIGIIDYVDSTVTASSIKRQKNINSPFLRAVSQFHIRFTSSTALGITCKCSSRIFLYTVNKLLL
jgi:hypothetical protein